MKVRNGISVLMVVMATFSLAVVARGQYTVTMSMFDDASAVATNEADSYGTYFAYDERAGGYIQEYQYDADDYTTTDGLPAVLGFDESIPESISVQISPTNSDWIDILSAPTSLPYADGSDAPGLITGYGAPSGNNLDNPVITAWADGYTGASNTYTTATDQPYSVYTGGNASITPVYAQIWSRAVIQGDTAADVHIIAINGVYALLRYNETITTYNVFQDPDDYFNAASWSSGTVPNGVDAVATFGSPMPETTVTLSQNLTLGTLLIDNPNSYTINGPGTLTMQTSSGDAQVFVNQGSHVINAAVVLATNTDVSLSTANLTLTLPVTSANGVMLTKNGPGTLTLAGGITTAGLTINAGSLVISPGAPASNVGSLYIASGATLDLNSALTVAYSGTSPVAAIQSAIVAGYDAGAWDGTSQTSSVISSSSAASTPGTAIGYADGSTDTGTAAAPGNVLVMYTWLGDLNLNGVVDSSDISTMVDDSGMTGADWAEGDINYDGVVNRDDWSLLLLGVAESGGRNIDTLPEPGLSIPLILAALLASRRRYLNSAPK